MDMKKVISYLILGVMSSPLFVWAGSQLVKVSVHEEKITTLKEDIKDLKDMTRDLHWYTIKRRNIEVPKAAR